MGVLLVSGLCFFGVNQHGTLILEWSSWDQPPEHSFWDRHLDGTVDMIDLLTYALPTFTDVTDAAGIVQDHHAVADYFASGIAWGDADNDGFLDLYVTDSDGPNHLFRNQGDGTFALSPFSSQVELPITGSSGANFVDYDNDGWLDLFVLNSGANTLFHNDSGTGFSDVTNVSGLGNTKKGQSGAWGDPDLDGDLDLYVVNWGEPGTFEDVMYLNNGDGTFTDITTDLGPQINRAGFAASFVDYDNDGLLDLYVVNDKQVKNVLWRNLGSGCSSWCFDDVSQATGSDTAVFGMGLATGDYDWDGDLDFYFTHIGPMVLLQNQTAQGMAVFTHQGPAAGVDFNCIGWGAVFFDYDNDGWLDLGLATMDNDPNVSNRLYRNRADGTFDDVSYACGVANMGASIGISYADYDRDGQVDLAVGNMGQGYVLYRNSGKGGVGHNWMSFELTGSGPIHRHAVGARVIVTTASKTMMQELKLGSSMGATNQLALHFGLGQEVPISVNVIWPDGTMQAVASPVLNAYQTVTYSAP